MAAARARASSRLLLAGLALGILAMSGSALALSDCCCDPDAASSAPSPCLSITASTCCDAPVAIEATGTAAPVPVAGAMTEPTPVGPVLRGDRPGTLRSEAFPAPLRTIILRL